MDPVPSSLSREMYMFITVSGKLLKLSFLDLNPSRPRVGPRVHIPKHSQIADAANTGSAH